MIMDTFEELAAKKLSEMQRSQVRLPFSQSGFSLRSLESVSPCAYLGAAAAITPLWKPVLKDSWQERYPVYARTVASTVEQVRGMVCRWEGHHLLPENPSDFWKFHTDGKGRYLDHVQRLLTMSSEDIKVRRFKDSLSPGDRARVLSASQKFASNWLQSSASDTRIENNLFVKAVQLRLGNPGESDSDPAEALSNKRTAPKIKDLRHKFLAQNIAKWAERAGAERAETEPKDLWTHDHLRPDVDLILGDKRFLVDVAVIHPTCPSHIVEARNALGGAAEMVHVKEEKYAQMAASIKATVLPAVMETFGAISEPLLELFKDIANYSSMNPYGLWSRHEIYTGLLLDNSMILQKWNARVLLHSQNVHQAAAAN